MITIILYAPDQRLHPLLASALKPEHRVVHELSPERIKQCAERNKGDVIILDFDLNYSRREEQLALCDQLRDCKVPIIVMTDELRRSTAAEFLKRGAFDVIGKPPSLIELRVIIQRAYEQAVTKSELESIRQTVSSTCRCDQLVGSSGRAQVVYQLIRRVASLNASVLITGESGTGKELVARAIHNLGSRSRHPFVAVSCGAIPETLVESELFGHDKGAFTGSTGGRAGYLEQAGEGTLLLDEIGELSLNTQVKLLRVLQQKEYTRLGSNRAMPLRARVLFATHRDLKSLVEAGTFRQDLFFRVNVMPLHVPALRDRTEDIPMLARYFLKKYAEEYDKPMDDVRPNAMELLVDYDWPGNIRELENVIQSAVILSDGQSLTPAELPEHIQQIAQEPALAEAADGFEGLLRQYKIDLATRAVLDCDGNKTLAARKLRVSRAYLHRLIRQEPVRINAA